MNVVQKMEALADEWHCGVEQKGKGHVPYIAHPRMVVALVERISGIRRVVDTETEGKVSKS